MKPRSIPVLAAVCLGALFTLPVACGSTGGEDDVAVAGEAELNASAIHVIGSIGPGETKTVHYAHGAAYPAFSFSAHAGDTVTFAASNPTDDYGVSPTLYLLAPTKRTLTHAYGGHGATLHRASASITAYETGTYYVAVKERHDRSAPLRLEFASVTAGAAEPADPCNACSDSCVSCAHQHGCGWDADYEVCRSGDVNGPRGKASTSSWEWGGDDCRDYSPPSSTCAATSCMTCTGLNGCGWLKKAGERGRCVAGAPHQPSDESLVLGEDEWDWYGSDCIYNDEGELPPGPVCVGSTYRPYDPPSPPDDEPAPSPSEPPADEPYLDWTCDVTTVNDGEIQHTTGSLCAFASKIGVEADYALCRLGNPRAASCSTSNCVSHGCCWNGCDR